MTPEEFALRSQESAQAFCEEITTATDSLNPNPIEHKRIVDGVPVLRIKPSGLIKVAHIVRDTIGMEFHQLSDITAVDWPGREPRFDVVYHLLSLQENLRLRLIISVDEHGVIPSLCELWPSANWYEREVWDMFGILFSDHPDLRRILTDYGFEGHPLHKDFPLSGNVELFYDTSKKRIVKRPVEIVQEFRDFDFSMPWNANSKDEGEGGVTPSSEQKSS